PRPVAECALRGIDRRLGIVDAGARHVADLVLGGRVDDVEACAVGRLLPFAADPQVGRHVGEQIVVAGAGLGHWAPHTKGTDHVDALLEGASGNDSTSRGKEWTSNGGAVTASESLKVAASCHLPPVSASTSNVLTSGSTYQQWPTPNSA